MSVCAALAGPSRAACSATPSQLRRASTAPRQPLRRPHAARRRSPAAAAPRALFGDAASVTHLAPSVGHLLGTFVLLYTTITWANLRRARIQAEQIDALRAAQVQARRERLRRLGFSQPGPQPGDAPEQP